MALGIIIAFLGLVMVVVHFLVQNITTTTNLTEILPNYITGLVVTGNGVIIVILFWRRHVALVFVEVILCIGVGAFCGALAVLTGTHILQPIISLQSCTHDDKSSVCACTSVYTRNALLLHTSSTDLSLYTFDGAASCSAVCDSLPIFLYVEIALLVVVFVLCVTTTVLAFLILRLERTSLATLQEETYEEIFTVSGSSSSDFGSEEEATIQTGSNISPAANCVNPAVKGYCDPIGQKQNGIYAQPIGILKNLERTVTPFSDSQRASRLIRSKSCDSIDEIYARSAKGPGSEKSPERGKGKLKEHRRRERRAVTLHNLDTKQLMSVLSLHMRYLEETETLHSQGKLHTSPESVPIELKRRAITPQPYHLKYNQTTTIPRTVRSHTPQPNQKLTEKQEKQYRAMMKTTQVAELIQTNSASLEVTTKSIGSPSLRAKILANEISHNKKNMGISQSLPNHCRKEIPSADGESVDASEIDDDITVKQMPKSRPSVQNYFLPPQPLHRAKSATPPGLPELKHRSGADKSKLPPQPIKRGEDQQSQLSPEPVHRGSAFEVVGHTGRLPDRTFIGNGLSGKEKIYARPGDIQCEKVLRENFKMYESPFLLQNGEKTYIQPNFTLSNHSARTLPPPPYAPPPSYKHFMSLSQDGSLSDTVDGESIDESLHYSQNGREDLKQNVTKVNGTRPENTLSSDDDVFLPEDRAIYSQVAKRSPRNVEKSQISPHHYHTPHVGPPIPPYRNRMTPHGDPMILPPRQPRDPRTPPPHDATYNIYANYSDMYHRQLSHPQKSVWITGHYANANNYEEIDDMDVNMTYSYDDNSSCGMSSRASLIPREQSQWMMGDGSAHPHMEGDPSVLETMI